MCKFRQNIAQHRNIVKIDHHQLYSSPKKNYPLYFYNCEDGLRYLVLQVGQEVSSVRQRISSKKYWRCNDNI